jgi:hypothetical protein
LRRREWASFRSNEQKGFDALVEEIRVVGDPSGRWRADKGSVASRLISDLSGIPPGHANAERYQGMIFRALDFVFSPWLQGGRKEQEISEGRKRVDIVFDNQAKDGFFADLKTKFDIHCPYIFIECKNYSADPENPEFDQLAGRFSDKRGQFGLLVCRSIENRKAMTARCKDLIRDNRGYILVLDDADIGALIQFRSAANISNLEAYLADRLRDLLLG